MSRFSTVRDAKNYLIDQILAQADREGIALTEIERKMLYFSETGSTLPDIMNINREFDENYDQNEYEKKIVKLIQGIYRRHKSNPDDSWDDAVSRLRTEDHYLLVMVESAFHEPSRSRRGDIVRLILAVIFILAVMFPLIFFIHAHIENPTIAKLTAQIALLALIVLVVYLANLSYRKSA
jgi:hypothetical protein